ncbi:hypothetical protein O181_003255 [Austropuccinia psidii MF-1]|uniref:Uncharacterized protein n=1 Tax=Austropuccinia psidii MF-1 TaxID=1389203 RepID=A0A9Q3GDQ2_9BASI|nr:hypothetical protein [Austropuccinia psidii MF-1]
MDVLYLIAHFEEKGTIISGGKRNLGSKGEPDPKFLTDRQEMSKPTQKFITFGLELSHRVCVSIDDEVLIPNNSNLRNCDYFSDSASSSSEGRSVDGQVTTNHEENNVDNQSHSGHLDTKKSTLASEVSKDPSSPR